MITRSGKKLATRSPAEAVTPEEQARALLKLQQLQQSKSGALVSGTTTNSSKRSCPSQINLNVTNNNPSSKVDPYLLKLLNVDEVAVARANAMINTTGTLVTNKSGSTEFRVPEPPAKKAKLEEDARVELAGRPDRPLLPAATCATGATVATTAGKPPPHPHLHPHHHHHLAVHVPSLPSQPSPVAAAIDIQASNSLEKTKTTQPSTDKANASDKGAKISGTQSSWDASDTRSVLGEDVYETLKTSVIQHQKEYLEQLFDLHRAIAVQRLLVRHSEDQKTLIHEFKKEEARTKKALQKAGLGFGTTTEWHKGLHPDSQFAALSSDQGTDAGSGDDATGSDVAASGSGGNGKSGNGSGGGSTSQFAPQLANAPILPGNMGLQRTVPSGASNTPMLAPWGGYGQMGSFGVSPVNNCGYMDMQMYQTNPVNPANMPYGDPMLFWYQDYCARLQQQQGKPAVAGATPQGGAPNGASAGPTAGQPAPGAGVMAGMGGMSPIHGRPMPPPVPKIGNARFGTLPVPFKWWHDPRTAFGAPGTKEILNRVKMETVARQEGTEVESAPPSEDATADDEPPKKTRKINHKNNQKNNEKNTQKIKQKNDVENDTERAEMEDRAATKPSTRKRRPRKRLLKDPVAAASSGTSGPLPHYSSDGVNTRQNDAVGNVAKLLLSISTKEAVSSGSRGNSRPRRRTSRKASR